MYPKDGTARSTCCDGPFAALGRDYLGCQPALRDKGCANTRTVRRVKLEAMVLETPGAGLMRPERVAAFCQAFIAEWNRGQVEASANADRHRRELQGVERKLDNLVEAIADGMRAPGLQRKLEELEARRAQLLAALEDRPAPTPALHPNLAAVHARRVAVLRAALESRNEPELLEAARALIDKVAVGPGDGPDGPPKIELVGHLTEMLRAGGADLLPAAAVAGGVLKAMVSSSAKGGPGAWTSPYRTSIGPRCYDQPASVRGRISAPAPSPATMTACTSTAP